MRLNQSAVRIREQRDDVVPGRDEIRLHNVIDSRGPFGTVTGDRVIQTRRRAVRFGGSDRDHIRIVAGRGDGSVAVRSTRIVTAVVTGGDDDYDARLPGLFYCLAERIERV